MGVNFGKTKYGGTKQPFWRGESKVLPGGFNLTQTLPKGTRIPRGTFVKVDFDKLEATIAKYVVVVGGGTTTEPRILKGSLVTVGEKLTLDGTTAVEITAVNNSDPDFDTLTLSQEIEKVQEGSVLYNPDITPEFVVESDRVVDFDSNITVSISYEAVLLKDIIGLVPDSWKEGHYLKNNHNILFINQ